MRRDFFALILEFLILWKEHATEHVAKNEEYRTRQEQLFILLYKITRILFKQTVPEDAKDTEAVVEDLLDCVGKEDSIRQDLRGQSNELHRYDKPFTVVLRSPRGYEREVVWRIIATVS